VPSPLGRRCHEVADEGYGIVSSEIQIPHPALSQANQPAQKRAGRRRDETWFSGLVLKINPPWPPFFKGGERTRPQGYPPLYEERGVRGDFEVS